MLSLSPRNITEVKEIAAELLIILNISSNLQAQLLDWLEDSSFLSIICKANIYYLLLIQLKSLS